MVHFRVRVCNTKASKTFCPQTAKTLLSFHAANACCMHNFHWVLVQVGSVDAENDRTCVQGMEGVRGGSQRHRIGCMLLHESAASPSSSRSDASDNISELLTTFEGLHKPAYSCAWECSWCKISLSLCHQAQMQATLTALQSMPHGPDVDCSAWMSPHALIMGCRAGGASGQELGGRVWDTVHEGVVQVALIALGIECGAVILVEGGASLHRLGRSGLAR